MSTLNGKLEQRNKDKYVGETTVTYLMKLNSTKAREVEKDLLSFYTNAIAYLMKWFNFSDKNYLKHIECLSLSREIECVLRLQPMVIMDELYEEFTTVQPYIAYLMQMTSFMNMNVGEKWVKVCSHQEVPLPNLIKIVSFVMSMPVSNAHVERLFSLMTCYWRKKRNQRSEDLVKAEIQVKFNYGLFCTDFHSFVLQNKKILRALRSSAKYLFKNSANKQQGEKKGGVES
jgi:hypothetical protein